MAVKLNNRIHLFSKIYLGIDISVPAKIYDHNFLAGSDTFPWLFKVERMQICYHIFLCIPQSLVRRQLMRGRERVSGGRRLWPQPQEAFLRRRPLPQRPGRSRVRLSRRMEPRLAHRGGAVRGCQDWAVFHGIQGINK
jgi:hypothetical protein